MRAKDSAPAKSEPTKAEGKLVLPEPREVSLVRASAVNRLRFSPPAWAKYHWLRDRSSNEVAGFGISNRHDITYIDDIRLLKQTVGGASAEFDEDDIPRYLDDMVDEGYQPLECMRIWLHTHPGNSASPSGTDVKTFEEAFGRADWAVMCILAQGGEIKAKVCLTAGNGQFRHEFPIPVGVDCTGAFTGVSKEDVERWEAEYTKYVHSWSRVVTVSAPSRGWYPDRQYHAVPNKHNDGGGYTFGDDEDDLYGLEYWRNRYGTDHYGADGDSDVESIESADFDLLEEFPYPEYIVETMEKPRVTFILLEERWFAYAASVSTELREGEAARCARDICEAVPVAFGELSWDYGDGEVAATTISDLNQTINFMSHLSFDDVYETIEEWLDTPVAEADLTVEGSIETAADKADQLAEEYMAELAEREQATDPSAETVHDGQPICEGQPDAHRFESP
jgi:proteasome lid subunit RPN8/RPN11